MSDRWLSAIPLFPRFLKSGWSRLFLTKDEKWTAFLTLLFVAATCLTILVIPRDRHSSSELNQSFISYITSIVPLVNTYWQRRLHLFLLLALAATCLLILTAIRGKPIKTTDIANADGAWFKLVLSSLLIAILGYLFRKLPLVFPDGAHLFNLDLHLAHSLGPSLRLAEGKMWLSGNHLIYGFLLPTLFAYSRVHLAFPVSDGDYFHAVEFLQLLFVFASALALGMWVRGSRVGFILALLTLSAWVANFVSIFYQNHSALRFLTFAIFPLGTLMLRRLDLKKSMSFWLGFLGGIGLFLNLETGIAAVAGLAVLQLMTANDLKFRSLSFRFAIFLFGVSAFVGTFAVTMGLGFGDWTLVTRLFSERTLWFASSQVDLGQPFVWSPLALLILAHSIYVLLLSTFRRARGLIDFTNAFKAALSTTILIWFSYYANRASPEYLQSLLPLYAFLVPDLVHGWSGRESLWRSIACSGLILLVIFPSCYFYWSSGVAFVHSQRVQARSHPDEMAVLSGVLVNKTAADAVLSRAHALSSRSGQFAYISAYPWLMPLVSGVDNGLSVTAPFAAQREKDVEDVKREIIRTHPDAILFESVTSGERKFLPEPFFRFQRNLRDFALVSGYLAGGSQGGWEVLIRYAAKPL